MEEDRNGESALVAPAELAGTSGIGSALVLLFLFFGIVGFGIFAVMFLILGFRDARDAVLCHSLSAGSLVLAAGCVATFSLVVARTPRKGAAGSRRPRNPVWHRERPD